MVSVSNTRFRRRGLSVRVAAVLAALAVAGALGVGAVAQQPTSPPVAAATSGGAAASPDQNRASRKPGGPVGIRGHGFVQDDGIFTTIDVPGATSFTVVFGITNSGQTVGGYVDATGTLHGFLLDNGAFTTIDFPGARATFATRINNRGQIVGAYSDGAIGHGFLLQKDTFTTIDAPGAVLSTAAFAINARGQILGLTASSKEDTP